MSFFPPGVRHQFSGRRALVVGLGTSGRAAAILLQRLGAAVTVWDENPRAFRAPAAQGLPKEIKKEAGVSRVNRASWDLVVPSPGVPPRVWEPWRRRGVQVWGEIELGYRFLSLLGRWPAWSAAITGTNGKTTTTSLLGAIFTAAGKKTTVAGNIGLPLCAVVDRLSLDSALALEISSYQLETAFAFRPSVGAVLNVTPDHLARHKTMANYARAKFRLFQSQLPSDTAVLNAGDPWSRRAASDVPGRVAWFGPATAVWHFDGAYLRGPDAADRWSPPRYLPGRHNMENALAAVACARALGASRAAVARALATFRGVEHRIESVRAWRGLLFVNDSKATNVDSTRVALEAMSGPIRLILGGQDKGAPYRPLAPLIRRKVRDILLIGEAAEKIDCQLRGVAPMVACGTLEKAVRHAADTGRPGETVLLSPACASFDQFNNYEHRGRCFKEEVGKLL